MDNEDNFSNLDYAVEPPDSLPRVKLRMHQAIDFIINKIEQSEEPNKVTLVSYEYTNYEKRSGILFFNLLLRINWIETLLSVRVDMFSRRKSDNSISYDIVTETFSEN